MYGFIRVGAAVPEVKVADCKFNREKIIELVCEAEENRVSIVVFPELCISSYTCGDLFLQSSLLKECENSLSFIAEKTRDKNVFIILGMPIKADNRIFNCAVVLNKGQILGVIPKTHIPNYGEFYEKRWFAGANELKS